MEPVCTDVEGHKDAGYEGCQWYVDNGGCYEYEDWLPASNCCECGGGDYGWDEGKYDDAVKDWDDYNYMDECQDVESHKDAGYEGCEWYAENGQCGEYEDWLSWDQCCVCGGGSYGTGGYDEYYYDDMYNDDYGYDSGVGAMLNSTQDWINDNEMSGTVEWESLSELIDYLKDKDF